MTIKKYRIPALLLAALTAVVLTFAMAAMVQTAYAADEYEVQIGGVRTAVRGETVALNARVMKGDEEIELPDGMHIEWKLDNTAEVKVKYVVPNDKDENRNKDIDKYVQVTGPDTTEANIEFKDVSVEDPKFLAFGLTAALVSDETGTVDSDTQQFLLTNNEYDVELDGVMSVVPGNTLYPKVIVKEDGQPVDLEDEGLHIEWGLGLLASVQKEDYVEVITEGNSNPDKCVQIISPDSAKIVFKKDVTIEDPYGLTFGLTATLMYGDMQVTTSDTDQFELTNQFDEVRYIGDDIDPYMLTDEEQEIQVLVKRHETGKLPADLKVKYVWTVDNDGVQILHNGNPVSGEVTGTNEKFTFKRKDTSKDTEVLLTIMDMSGNIIENNRGFSFYEVTYNLADYQIEFNGNAEDPFVFVDKEDLPIAINSTACRITVVSGKGDGNVVPEEAYDLKVQKVIGYYETTWEDVLQDAAFPLTVDEPDSFNINGDRTGGTAQYVITAVAKKGNEYGYAGQTGSGTGRLWLLDRKALTWPSVDAGFSDKHYNIYQFRYEVKKGKKLTPFARSVENFRNLTLNKDYKVTYINKKTNKVYNSFPTKAGEYKVVFSGISPYYGQNDSYTLLVGKKNTMKAKGKTIVCKTKMKKGKTAKNKSFKASRAVSVTKAKGEVSYTKVSGNDNITVSDSGKIKVKKGTKKGTYKIKIEVTAQGTSTYISGSKTVKVKVRVK